MRLIIPGAQSLIFTGIDRPRFRILAQPCCGRGRFWIVELYLIINNRSTFSLRKAAFLGAFLPRRIQTSAAFTHLLHAFTTEFSECEWFGVAISDVPRNYSYPSRIQFEINQARQEEYRSAAVFLRLKSVELVYIQYSANLINSEEQRYLLEFTQLLDIPFVMAISQVPDNAQLDLHSAFLELARRADRLVVFDEQTAASIGPVEGIDQQKIRLLPFPFHSKEFPLADAPAWRAFARNLMDCFLDAIQAHRQDTIRRVAGQPAAQDGPAIPVTGAESAGQENGLPVLKLDHFLRMTDETGILRSSVTSLPDYQQGYTTADNARALMFSLLLEQVGEGPFIPIEMQASRHLAFLWNAYNAGQGRFRDAMSYSRAWQDETGSEDTHGLAVWALGVTLGRSTQRGLQSVAAQLFGSALPAAQSLSNLRAQSFCLLGIQEYLRRFPGDRSVARAGKMLAGRLVRQFLEIATPDWPWFEESLHANSACIPQALLAIARWAEDDSMAKIGLKTLDWLVSQQFTGDGMFIPFGDQGYYRRQGQRARFAQRPVEARAMISACLEAYRYTRDAVWLERARGAFQWFLGRNELGQPLYDPETGGCCDGLLPGRIDSNCSSEALLAFLMAQLEMRLFGQLYQLQSADSARLPILHFGLPNSTVRS